MSGERKRICGNLTGSASPEKLARKQASKCEAYSVDRAEVQRAMAALVDAIKENNRDKVSSLLGKIPRESLALGLIDPRGTAKTAAAPSRGRKAAGLKGAEWMGQPQMPWNPAKKFQLDSYRCTCLHVAAVLGKAPLCQLLLERGADPKIKDSASNPVLLLAAASGDPATVKVILNAGVSKSEMNDNDMSALHVACKQKNVEVVKLLLDQPAVDVNKASAYPDEIPLFLAAYFGHLQVVKLLVEKGADVNRKVPVCNLTALHMAARCSHANVVDFLVSSGAELNAVAWVTSSMRERKLRFDFSTTTMSTGSPLNFAVESARDGPAPCVKALLKHGADTEATTERHPYTPLMTAVSRCKIQIAKMLLEAGAKVDGPGKKGALSPLTVALFGLHTGGWGVLEAKVMECVKLLVESGASLAVKDPGTKGNCLHVCVMAEFHEIFSYLLEKGADPWDMDYKGIYPAKYCLKGEHGNPRPWALRCIQAGILNKKSMVDYNFGVGPLELAISFDPDMNLVRMYEAAGLISRRCMKDVYVDFNRRGLNYCKTVVRNVLPLKYLARRAASDAVGERQGRLAAIQSLPVSEQTRDCLLYKDFEPLAHAPQPNPHGRGFDVENIAVHSYTDGELTKNRQLILEMRQYNLDKPVDPYWDDDDDGGDGAENDDDDDDAGVDDDDDWVDVEDGEEGGACGGDVEEDDGEDDMEDDADINSKAVQVRDMIMRFMNSHEGAGVDDEDEEEGGAYGGNDVEEDDDEDEDGR